MKPKMNLQEKVKEYKQNFNSAKITDTDNYLSQTLGETIKTRDTSGNFDCYIDIGFNNCDVF